MAGYGGYFLQGLSSGISQGMDWGQQILDIRERKKAKDELKSLQDKISVASTDFTKMVNQYGADNMYSDKEMLDLQTFAFGIGAEFQEMVKPIIQNIEQGNTGQVKEQIKQIDDYVSYIFSLNLQPGQVEQAISNFKNSKQWSESAQRYWDAEEAMVKSMAEARQMQPEQPQTEMYPSVEALWQAHGENTPYKTQEVNGQIVYLPEYQAPAPEPTGVEVMGEQNNLLDIVYARGDKEVFNAFAKSLGINTTFDTYKRSYEEQMTPITEPIKRTDIAYWEEEFNDVTNEEDYNRKYNLLMQSDISKQYKPESYQEILTNDLKQMAKEIQGLLSDKNTLINTSDKADYEKYQAIYEEKVKELLSKYPDIDKNQFPKFLSYDERKKLGWWKYSLLDEKGW